MEELGDLDWHVYTTDIHEEVKVAQSCPTLCDPIDYTVHGILQARILEWVAMFSSRDLPNPGIEPRSPALHADSLSSEPPVLDLKSIQNISQV